MNELTDEELMVMYQNGTEKAFQILYGRHSSKIFSFLKKRIKKDEQVTDIYQEVFMKIHRSKQLYNKTLPVLPWLFTITKSVMLDELKKDKHFKFNDEFNLEQIADQSLEIKNNLGEVESHLHKLSNTQKTAIQMKFVDDKTFDEIAESLKTTPSNVRQILSRGIKRLKELMNEGG